MIQLKGSGKSHGSQMMKKAMGMGLSGEAGATPLAKTLGLPSASLMPRGAGGQVGSIALEAPSIRSKTTPSAHTDEEADRDKEEKEKDEDDDLDDDEDDGMVAAWREKRLAELKKKGERTQEFLAMGHGTYTTVTQDDFLPSVTKSKFVVCHFFHSNFERSKIVDKHLSILCKKHLATKFIKIDAEKSPFFATKLMIKVLPTLVFFKDGIAVDRLVGFEELGGKDEFSTEILEKRIEKSGLLLVGLGQSVEDKDKDDEDRNKPKNSIRTSTINARDDLEDDDD